MAGALDGLAGRHGPLLCCDGRVRDMEQQEAQEAHQGVQAAYRVLIMHMGNQVCEKCNIF